MSAWDERRPEHAVADVETLQPALEALHAAHGDVALAHVRVFAQLCILEPGDELGQILGMAHFFPRIVTVTVRHTDWWYWEDDEPLQIGAQWVTECEVPESVAELRLELESLKRKRPSIERVAGEICAGWRFGKRGGQVMMAKEADCEDSDWTGASTWDRQRWVRDEDEAMPNTLAYFVRTVVFKDAPPANAESRQAESIEVPYEFQPRLDYGAYLSAEQLEDAGVPPGASAGEAIRLVRPDWYDGSDPTESEEESSWPGSDDGRDGPYGNVDTRLTPFDGDNEG